MTTRRVVLVGVIVLLAVLPFVVHYFRGESLEMESELDQYTPIEDVLARHDTRIEDRINLLKKQSLDETFVELLEDQQYYYPSFHSQVHGVPRDIEIIFSTRTFLKVFQQFDALPREQAVAKLNEFCKRAIKEYKRIEYGTGYDDEVTDYDKPLTAHYMLCASMLLAARVGEHKVLLYQMDEMQRIFDAYTVRMKVAHPDMNWEREGRAFDPLEDDCFLTVLMYALKQAKMDIPIDENTLVLKTVPLCRWDAPFTHYDFAVWHGNEKLNPQDVVEQFVVYAFSHKDYLDIQKKKLIINTLKECLSK